MKPRLEHGNLTVRDVEAMVRFVSTALPELVVRGRGTTGDGREWVHVGTDTCYLAFDRADKPAVGERVNYDGSPGLNHLGFVVDDVAGVRSRLLEAGYRESTVPNAHPHRTRVYFLDPEGNDWEFIEYHSEREGERNDYALPDV
jgi:catechol 2,3-dioxygenase-like lactoylglutathione lyase family enzyme